MKLLRLIFLFMAAVLFFAGQQTFADASKEKEVAKESIDGCVEPAAGPIVEKQPAAGTGKVENATVTANPMTARVGYPAPNFEAPSYQNGSFKNIKLSDFKGKWVILCFYPGDFTFV